jgi:hypothetical protein
MSCSPFPESARASPATCAIWGSPGSPACAGGIRSGFIPSSIGSEAAVRTPVCSTPSAAPHTTPVLLARAPGCCSGGIGRIAGCRRADISSSRPVPRHSLATREVLLDASPSEREFLAPDGRTWTFRVRPEARKEEASTHLTLELTTGSETRVLSCPRDEWAGAPDLLDLLSRSVTAGGSRHV